MRPSLKSYFSYIGKPDQALFFALLAYIFAHFFISSDLVYRWVMLIGFLPVGIYALVRQRFSALKELSGNPVFLPFCAFLGYAVLQSLYLYFIGAESAKPLLHCFCLGIYLFSVMLIFTRISARNLLVYHDYILGCCVISGLIALAIYGIQLSTAATFIRLSGIGANINSNLGGFVFAQCGILAIGLFLDDRNYGADRWRKIFLAGACCVVVAFIIASQSKGVILSFVSALVILLALFNYKKTALLLAGSIVCGGVFLFFVFIKPLPDLVAFFRMLPLGESLYLRGDSYRLGIWERAVELIRLKPLIGYGLGAPFPYKFTHPHNLLLSVSFYMGLSGLFLYLIMVFKTVIIPAKNPFDTAEKIYYTQFWVMLFGGIADFCEPIHGVSVMWVILWLPFAIFHGLRARPAASATLEE